MAITVSTSGVRSLLNQRVLSFLLFYFFISSFVHLTIWRRLFQFLFIHMNKQIMCAHTHTHTLLCVNRYIGICREREREREIIKQINKSISTKGLVIMKLETLTRGGHVVT